MKANTIVSNSSACAVQWLRTTDYKLTTLIIQAQDASGVWHDLQRTTNEEETNKFDFNGAEYTYNITRYDADQDSETKMFSMTETMGITRTVTVTSTGTVSNGIQRDIQFTFDTEGTSLETVKDNIRVIALFRKNKADVSGEKYVLAGELPSSKLLTASSGNGDSSETKTTATDTASSETAETAAERSHARDDADLPRKAYELRIHGIGHGTCL